MLDYNELFSRNPVLDSMDFVVFDFETTGLDYLSDEIVEIGAVRMNHKDGITDHFSTLINPGCDIPRFVTKIHGIRNEDVFDKPNAFFAIKKFLEFSRDSLLVAHNAKFDGLFLQKYLCKLYKNSDDIKMAVNGSWILNDKKNTLSFDRFQQDIQIRNSGHKSNVINFNKQELPAKNVSNPKEIKWEGKAILDTITLARSVFPGLLSYSLQNLKKHWQIPSEKSHRGLDDALAAAKILEKCLNASIRQNNDLRFRNFWNMAESSFVTGMEGLDEISLKKQKNLQDMIQKAITENSKVEISYKNLAGRVSQRLISPRSLYYTYAEGYIEAFCHKKKI